MIKPITLIILGLVGMIVQNIYFIRDDRTANTDPKDKPLKAKWHIAGGLIHAWMYYVIADNYGYHWGAVMASLTWLFFDGFINSYALKREFFYIGNTAALDRFQHWLAGLINKLLRCYFIDPRELSACLKIGFTIYSLYTLIRHYGKV